MKKRFSIKIINSFEITLYTIEYYIQNIPDEPPTRDVEERKRTRSLSHHRNQLASRELQVPRNTVHKVVRKRLKLYAYKVQTVQALHQIDEDNGFLQCVCFSNEATFHVNREVNRHNVIIWESENSHSIREHIRNIPKINVC